MTDRMTVKRPAVLVATGTLLLLVAVHHHVDEVLLLNRGVGPILALLLDGIPAIVLAGAGFWLARTDLCSADQWTVCVWSLTALVLSAAVIGATVSIRAFEGRPIAEPQFPLLVAAEMGGLGGFVAGYYNVRAQERAREAQRVSDQLEETNERLEASNERLEEFAYAVSHDLKEPLRMVSSYVQLLEDRYADELDEDAREFIDFAVDGADRMGTMIDSLLEYSRIERGAPLEPTDADEVLAEVLVDLQFKIEESGATVTADDLPTVVADADQLAHVFQNLISNAIKYRGDEPPRIHVGVQRTPDAWRFAVADNGMGMDPADTDEVFEMFHQLSPGEDGDSTAGGIGLAMCERIVERHGGDIWVESEPGTGSIFYFTIPAEAPDDGASQRQTASNRDEPTARELRTE